MGVCNNLLNSTLGDNNLGRKKLPLTKKYSLIVNTRVTESQLKEFMKCFDKNIKLANALRIAMLEFRRCSCRIGK